MRRLLYFLGVLFLLWTIISTGGWYLCCNTPCPPNEVVYLKGDTVFISPEPTTQLSLKDTITNPKPKGIIQKVKASLGLRKEDTHVVRKGETMYGIATRTYGIPVSALMALNNRVTFDLKAGDKLFVGTLAQRDSIRKSYGKDSLYTYIQPFGDSVNVKGSVYTESTGKVLLQHIDYELLGKYEPRNTLSVGGMISSDRNLHALGIYQLKNGVSIIGQVGITEKTYQLGVAKELNFKKDARK